MTEVPVDDGPDPTDHTDEVDVEDVGAKRRGGRRGGRAAVDIEREVTKRHLIETISSVLVVVLYMVFTLVRDRDAGVVAIGAGGVEDDWQD